MKFAHVFFKKILASLLYILASFKLKNKEKGGFFKGRLISPKTSATEADGRLLDKKIRNRPIMFRFGHCVV
jgi:hypothetical protein